MRVVIVGAGSVGLTYGSLFEQAGLTVQYYAPTPETMAVHIQCINKTREHSIDQQNVVTEIPQGADYYLIALPSQHVKPAFETIRTHSPTAIIMTVSSMAPQVDFEAGQLGLFVCGLAAHRRGNTIRYWESTRVSTVLHPKNQSIAKILSQNDLSVELVSDVESLHLATTLVLLPMLWATSYTGGIDPLIENQTLLKLSLQSTSELKTIANQVGRLHPWLSSFSHFLGKFTLKAGLSLLRSRHPEAIVYFDKHLTQHLKEQHRWLAHQTLHWLKRERINCNAFYDLLDHTGVANSDESLVK